MTAPLSALGPAASVETILAAVDAGNASFWQAREDAEIAWHRFLVERGEPVYVTLRREKIVDRFTRAALAHRDAVAGLRWFKSDARALCMGMAKGFLNDTPPTARSGHEDH